MECRALLLRRALLLLVMMRLRLGYEVSECNMMEGKISGGKYSQNERPGFGKDHLHRY